MSCDQKGCPRPVDPGETECRWHRLLLDPMNGHLFQMDPVFPTNRVDLSGLSEINAQVRRQRERNRTGVRTGLKPGQQERRVKIHFSKST